MPHARPARRTARVLVYGSLALGLAIALYPPSSLSRQRQDSPEPPLSAKDRATYHAILTRYLGSLPGGAPAPALASLATTEDATLARLITWLPLPTEQRPSLLFETGLPQDSALFPALLKTSLIGVKPAPLASLPQLIQQLPLEKADPLRLHLLQAAAARAETEQATPLQLLLLSEAARHPAAAWPEIETLLHASHATQQTDEATALLSDWLDDPPATAGADQVATARCHLARLHLTARRLPQAAAVLQPLLPPDSSRAAPHLPALDIAWTLVGLSRDPAPLIPHIETVLSRHPHHQLHWRELAAAPPPAPEYLQWLPRLASASAQADQHPRAVEAALHLAILSGPDHLLPHLPAAQRLGRMADVLDLLDHLPGQPALALATACQENQDTASARHLLEHFLKAHPGHLPAIRLLLQVRTRDLPPMQTAMHWRRHLQQHPSDIPAQHHLLSAWLSARQPQAAVNHLLATDPARLDTTLRQRTAQLALENRQNTAFTRAIQRLLDARDPAPPDSLPRWTQHLHALGQPALAAALR